ncbi:MAG TPA: hypothetical protein PKM20_02210, partial [Nitrosomonas sp.]|nr:hypothetical protein [Nitrosomonas sp.]
DYRLPARQHYSRRMIDGFSQTIAPTLCFIESLAETAHFQQLMCISKISLYLNQLLYQFKTDLSDLGPDKKYNCFVFLYHS